MFGATDDVVCRFTVSFEQEVGFADGVRIAVDLLTEQVRGHILAVRIGDLLKRLLSDGQHAARAARAVVQQVRTGLDLVGYGQKHQVRHQPHCITRGPVLACLFVVVFLEAADQFLEQRAHGVVVESRQFAYRVGTEVDVFVEELFNQLAESVGFREARNLVAKLKVGQDVLYVRRESVEIGLEVVPQLLLRSARLAVAEEEMATCCRTPARTFDAAPRLDW